MSKSLEALDKLCDLATQDSTCLNYVIGLAMNIKQELEHLVQLEKENQELKEELNDSERNNEWLREHYGIYKKVIEIIKSKNVDIFFLVNNCEFVLDNYNYEIEDDIMKYCYKDCSTLTQQECDLLKEVLE